MKRPQPWNMASVRSRQTPRVYKPCAPVGERPADHRYAGWHYGATCLGCGYHVCSCEPEDADTRRARELATRLGYDFDNPHFQKGYQSTYPAGEPTLSKPEPREYTLFNVNVEGNPHKWRPPTLSPKKQAEFDAAYAPSEETLDDFASFVQPPNPGPAGPRSAFDIALDARIKHCMEQAELFRLRWELG